MIQYQIYNNNNNKARLPKKVKMPISKYPKNFTRRKLRQMDGDFKLAEQQLPNQQLHDQKSRKTGHTFQTNSIFYFCFLLLYLS